MTSTGSNILSFLTTNGLSNLELTELITDDLRANNFNSSRVAADFVQIQRIETDDILIDTEIELANNGHIILKKDTEDEVILNGNVLSSSALKMQTIPLTRDIVVPFPGLIHLG